MTTEERLPWPNGEWVAAVYTMPDGRKIETVEDCIEVVARMLKKRPENGYLYGVALSVEGDDEPITVCLTGNGPKAEYHAQAIAELPRLAEEAQRLEAALAASEAARDRAERERDALIEAWPCGPENRIRWVQPSAMRGDREYQVVCSDGRWQGFPTKAEAVRAFAYLDTTTTEQPAQGEGE